MQKALMIGLVALTVAGCSKLGRGEQTLFDGQRFRASAKSTDRGDKATFTSTARPVAASLEGAAQAAAHEAVRHCIRYFGTSEIVWTIGPDSIDSAPQIDGDSLILQGTCQDVQG